MAASARVISDEAIRSMNFNIFRFQSWCWCFIALIRIISERESRLTSTCTQLIITKENQAFILIFF